MLVKNLMISKKQNSVILIFCLESYINRYFIDSWNPIDNETTQGPILLLHNEKYDNIRKGISEKLNIL